MRLAQIVSIAAILLVARAALAGSTHYFVGVDSSPVMTFNDYAGLPNPNHRRLTFLVADASGITS